MKADLITAQALLIGVFILVAAVSWRAALRIATRWRGRTRRS